MEKDFIPVFKPFLTEDEKIAANNVLDVGWLGMGKNVGEFEAAVSEYLNLKDHYTVAVSTGHAALHLALLLMNVGPGDEVITPSFNNTSDFQAIIATGAEPVFCDIEEDTLNIDHDCLLCDHDTIQDIANKHNLKILHDAAHSFGSQYKGKKVGTFSDITMFSFDPVKTITCIDGGALIVKTEEEVQKLHEMRLVGMSQAANVMYTNSRAWSYDIKALGFRYHMSNMHAAIGLSQLKKLDVIEKTRRDACRHYNKQLQSIDEVITPKTNFDNVIPFLYYIRVPKEDRDSLREFLFHHNIDNGIHWQPGHQFSLFQNSKKGNLTITEKISEEIISLPLHSNMKLSTIDRISTTIQNYFIGKKRGTGNFIFKNNSSDELELIGDFEGLYQNIEDPWEQSSQNSHLIPYYTYCRTRLIEVLKTLKNNHIIEIGAGLGDVTKLIKEQIAPDNLIGVDISKTAINKAIERYPSIKFIDGDIIKTSFGYQNQFDIVILNQMLWFVIYEFEEVLKNVSQLLKKDGYLVISMGFPKEQKFAKDLIDGHEGLVKYLKDINNNYTLTYEEKDFSNQYEYDNTIICLQKTN